MSQDKEDQLQGEIDRMKEQKERITNDSIQHLSAQLVRTSNELTKVAAETKHQTEMLYEIKATLEDANVTLNGTSSVPEKGLKVRVDRLEQREVERKWRQRIIETTLIGLLIKALISLIKGS